MNSTGRLTVLLAAAVLFAGGAFFAYKKMQEPVNQGPDPTRLGRAPVFELTSHTGEPFSSEALKGKVWVADFFFTQCQGICPVLTQRLQEVGDALKPYTGWELVSFSVDPEHDTPQALAAYRREHGVTLDNWHFLTGSKQEIRTLIREGFRLPVQDNPDNTDEPILHSSRMVLLDQEGNFRGFYDVLDADALEGLKRDAAQLLQ